MTRAQVIDAVEQSFALMKKSMIGIPDAGLETMTEYSRQKVTLRSAWTRTTVHIHEHLGQLIAYARTNKEEQDEPASFHSSDWDHCSWSARPGCHRARRRASPSVAA